MATAIKRDQKNCHRCRFRISDQGGSGGYAVSEVTKTCSWENGRANLRLLEDQSEDLLDLLTKTSYLFELPHPVHYMQRDNVNELVNVANGLCTESGNCRRVVETVLDWKSHTTIIVSRTKMETIAWCAVYRQKQ